MLKSDTLPLLKFKVGVSSFFVWRRVFYWWVVKEATFIKRKTSNSEVNCLPGNADVP